LIYLPREVRRDRNIGGICERRQFEIQLRNKGAAVTADLQVLNSGQTWQENTSNISLALRGLKQFSLPRNFASCDLNRPRTHQAMKFERSLEETYDLD